MESIVNKRIKELKKEKNAIILTHYYAPAEAQELADFVGDSYYLAKAAKGTDAQTVVFCGVAFMAESVKIMNPEKTVLMPDMTADCPMAHMADAKKIAAVREKYDDLAVVCYINSTAELKKHSDVCVTSANAVKIVRNLPNKNIYFIPDGNLGRYVAEKVPDKNIILNDGFCPIHAKITVSKVEELLEIHPKALVLSHPECQKEVLKLSDFVGSTSEILSFVKNDDAKEYIICTEDGVSYPLSRDNPDKLFYYVTKDFPCKDMKLNTAEKILKVLETGENEIKLPPEESKGALLPLEKMLELAKKE